MPRSGWGGHAPPISVYTLNNTQTCTSSLGTELTQASDSLAGGKRSSFFLAMSSIQFSHLPYHSLCDGFIISLTTRQCIVPTAMADNAESSRLACDNITANSDQAHTQIWSGWTSFLPDGRLQRLSTHRAMLRQRRSLCSLRLYVFLDLVSIERAGKRTDSDLGRHVQCTKRHF